MAHTKVDMKGDASIAITHVRRKKCDFPRCLDRRRLQKRRVGALRGSGRKNQSRLRAINGCTLSAQAAAQRAFHSPKRLQTLPPR